jgi:twitching motility protein PilT
VSQRLVPKIGGGRLALCEILRSNSRTREYIERGESEGKSLLDAMEQGETEGMQTFDSQIEKLIRSGVVSKDDGLAYASNYGNLLLRLGEFGHTEHPKAKPAPEPKSGLNAGYDRKMSGRRLEPVICLRASLRLKSERQPNGSSGPR